MCCSVTRTTLPFALIRIVRVILFSESRDVKESFVDCEKYEAGVLTFIMRFRELKMFVAICTRNRQWSHL